MRLCCADGEKCDIHNAFPIRGMPRMDTPGHVSEGDGQRKEGNKLSVGEGRGGGVCVCVGGRGGGQVN